MTNTVRHALLYIYEPDWSYTFTHRLCLRNNEWVGRGLPAGTRRILAVPVVPAAGAEAVWMEINGLVLRMRKLYVACAGLRRNKLWMRVGIPNDGSWMGSCLIRVSIKNYVRVLWVADLNCRWHKYQNFFL